MNLRMPRVLFAVLTGIGLAMAGAAMQGLFHNPLADPGIIGVTGGAATGAVVAIVVLAPLQLLGFEAIVSVSAFAGGALATVLVYLLARPGHGSGTARLLLVGVALGSGFAAITGYLTYAASTDELESIVFWQLGSFGKIDWLKLGIATGPILVAAFLLTRLHRSLDMLTLGERQAQHLGLDVRSTRRYIIVLAAVLTGTCVAFAGSIGFIGLVVPHIVRMMCGPRHAIVLPLSGTVGAFILVAADTAARSVAPPGEVPIGVFTAALGAPFFLWLVMRSDRSSP